MDFKIDENLPIEVARLLSLAGHTAFTVLDQGLGGGNDQAIADRCKAERRVLVTLDAGFADIRAYPPSDCPGLIVLRLDRQDKETVLRVISRLRDLLERERIAERLWIVDEQRVRIRE